MTRVASTANK